ncbi:hypothetical protein HMPREF9078_02224 [Capnocytophaga sp. oral taxon 380 str. F0488]|nr:hypothetical protein HMPREF9078_02224 [Capnocytophaga sp. oral taxon 380 str. F0488]
MIRKSYRYTSNLSDLLNKSDLSKKHFFTTHLLILSLINFPPVVLRLPVRLVSNSLIF